MKNALSKDTKYWSLLEEMKVRIRSTQIKAAVSVNKELLALYWIMGKRMVEEQDKSDWGDSVIDALSADLSKEFSHLKGFSRTNLFNIRKWYLFYSKADKKVQQLVGQLPWGHNVLIVTKSKDVDTAIFYVCEALRNNWSRNVLLNQIDSRLHRRKGASVNNFSVALPKAQSELANETLKDPYVFDFLTLGMEFQEKDLENQLMDHITKFLLELGSGFAFVGKQFPLEVSGKEYLVDLLFYHLGLRSYVVIELKSGEFRPEFAGKLNFYLSAVDSSLKTKDDNPSIGLILCKTKDKVTAEYALRGIAKPIGVSAYELVRSIPKKLKSSLPSVEEIEEELTSP